MTKIQYWVAFTWKAVLLMDSELNIIVNFIFLKSYLGTKLVIQLFIRRFSFISESSTKALKMNISSARIKRAKATGFFVLLRNLLFLVLSAIAFFVKRNVIGLVYFIVGVCIDLYLLFSIFIIIKRGLTM